MSAITIITPTFNRSYLLSYAYESLKAQTCKDFEWLVVDDGGSDDTADVVAAWQQGELFDIRYYHKPNGGQHSAINLGVRHAEGRLVMLLDSDDRYHPDAVQAVLDAWGTLDDTSNVAGMLFLREYSDGRVIGHPFDGDLFLADRFEAEVKKNIRGDKCGVWRREVLEEFPFPEIPGENWLPKSVVWNRITRKYKSLYVNRAIYVTEYLEEGLTRQNKVIKLRNPRGMAISLNEQTLPDTPFPARLRMCRNYIGFARLADNSIAEIIREAHAPALCVLMLLPGLLNGWKRRVRLQAHLRERARQAVTAPSDDAPNQPRDCDRCPIQ